MFNCKAGIIIIYIIKFYLLYNKIYYITLCIKTYSINSEMFISLECSYCYGFINNSEL